MTRQTLALFISLLLGNEFAMAQSSTAPSSSIAPQPFHAWAATPPMGWNSWDCYGTAVTEDQVKANADYMAEKLLSHGWNLITVDIQWYEPNAKGHSYREGAPLTMDGNGRLLPAPNKHPSSKNGAGFKPLSDYLHDKKLKLGVHLMRGIPRQAVMQNTPILNTEFHAADIANQSDTCFWNPDMFGVDMSKPGAQAYYDSVFALFAEWGVDFVKVDDLSRPYEEHKPEIEAIRKAIDKTGRPMILSTSPGETVLSAGVHVAEHANQWRISDDFWDKWELLRDQFERCRKWVDFQGPGYWPDADMLSLGQIRVGTKEAWTHFTHDEQLTHMTLWSIFKSPLIFGGNLPGNDEWTLKLMTNDEVIAVNQKGQHPRQVSNDNGLIVWTSDGENGAKYVALFNSRDGQAAKVSVKLTELGFSGEAAAQDLWTHQAIGPIRDLFSQEIPPHGAGMYRLAARQQ